MPMGIPIDGAGEGEEISVPGVRPLDALVKVVPPGVDQSDGPSVMKTSSIAICGASNGYGASSIISSSSSSSSDSSNSDSSA
jgi:hypothetical protein